MNDMSRVMTGLTAWQGILNAPAGFLELLPISIYMCDAEGRVVAFNRRAAELWGREPRIDDDTERFCGSFKLFSLDGVPIARHETPMAYVLKTGEAVEGKEAFVGRPDGSVIRTMAHISPVKDEHGNIVGAVNCFHDVTEQRRNEERVRYNEQRLRDVLEAIPVAIYTTDANGRITFYNRAAVEFAGRTPELGTDEWCVTWKLYWPDGTPLPHDQCPMALALKEGKALRGAEAVAERPDGTRVPFIPFPKPLRDADGNVIGAINMLVDITDRKLAEDRHKTLVDELNHRVKNTLATVQSLAAQTLRAPKVPKDVRGAFEARLFALSKAHDHLTRAHWKSADLKSIVQDIFAPYRYLGGDRLRVHGDVAEINAQAAMTLSMILHELAANAAKYGALFTNAGRVDVAWKVIAGDHGRRLVIDWREFGGPPVDPPLFKGFGSRLLENGVKQSLKGTSQITFDPAGVRCTMDIPFPAVTGL